MDIIFFLYFAPTANTISVKITPYIYSFIPMMGFYHDFYNFIISQAVVSLQTDLIAL
jgi:hypothetical protein